MASSEAWTASEAKARFSELRHLLRQGKTIMVSDHGEPGPEERSFGAGTGIEARVERLRGRGILSAPRASEAAFSPVSSRPGGLARFLQDR